MAWVRESISYSLHFSRSNLFHPFFLITGVFYFFLISACRYAKCVALDEESPAPFPKKLHKWNAVYIGRGTVISLFWDGVIQAKCAGRDVLILLIFCPISVTSEEVANVWQSHPPSEHEFGNAQQSSINTTVTKLSLVHKAKMIET